MNQVSFYSVLRTMLPRLWSARLNPFMNQVSFYKNSFLIFDQKAQAS